MEVKPLGQQCSPQEPQINKRTLVPGTRNRLVGQGSPNDSRNSINYGHSSKLPLGLRVGPVVKYTELFRTGDVDDSSCI